MSAPELLRDIVSIVVRGNISPNDVSPQTLFKAGLIGQPEYDDTEYSMFAPNEIAEFTAGWLRCVVRSNHLQVATSDQGESERLRDVAVGLLQRLQPAVGSLGINRHVHFSVESLDAWHRIGDTLAPKDPWTGVLDVPGTRTVTILGIRPDNYSGRIQITVEPSQVFPQAIYLATNDHFGLQHVESQPTSRDELTADPEPLDLQVEKRPVALEILNNEWSKALRRTETFIEHIARLGGTKGDR